MKVKEKILLDRQGLTEHGPINIVIFGDSISHGGIRDYVDHENVYWNRFKKKLHAFRDYMPVNMINASIGGTNATRSLSRMDRDVLKHEPDLVIVCFGLNDVNGTLENYVSSLETIFRRCLESGAEVVFMTPNMLNTSILPDTPEKDLEYARKTADMQNSGRMDQYIAAAIDAARREGVAVCDCYAKWKELAKTQDITYLLANRINHPTPEMHALFADALWEVVMGDAANVAKNESTMLRKEDR